MTVLGSGGLGARRTGMAARSERFPSGVPGSDKPRTKVGLVRIRSEYCPPGPGNPITGLPASSSSRLKCASVAMQAAGTPGDHGR